MQPRCTYIDSEEKSSKGHEIWIANRTHYITHT
jgi:hypothetical protein